MTNPSTTPLPSPSLSLTSSSTTPPPYWHAAAAAAAAAASTPGLRTIRPSAPDIDGTETERAYFHDFRHAAEEGLCQHVANSTPFWSWTVPHLCLAEPAVRYAMVALGAALRGYRHPEPHTPGTPSKTEVFTLNSYGQAMTVLGKASRDAPGVTATTLVCCLAFVAIECLRGNWGVALRHLSAGLAIIDGSVPLEDLVALADPRGALPSTGQLAGDTDYVVRMFAALELSACLFQARFRPVIALKLLRAPRAAAVHEVRDVGEAHRATTQYCRDVCAAAWEWNAGAAAGDVAKGGREELLGAGQRLEDALRRFGDGPLAPKIGSAADASLRLDMLHAVCCRQLARVAASGASAEEAYEEIVRLAEGCRRGIAALGPDAERRFVLDVGLVAAVHFVVYNCGEGGTRERALGVLSGWARRENFWDGPEVGALLERGAGEGLPRGLGGGAAIPALMEKLGGLRIGEGEGGGGGKGRERSEE